MTRISSATLFGLPIESLDEMLARVDAIEVDDLTDLCRRALRGRAPPPPPASVPTKTVSARPWGRSARAW